MGRGRIAHQIQNDAARMLGARLHAGESRRSVVQKPNDAGLILKTMVAVAAADGRLDAREVALIQKVYQDQTGRSVT